MNNQAKIAELKKNINNKFFPEALKPKLLAQIEKLEEEDKASENKGILPHPKPKQSKTSVAKTDGMPKFVVGDIVKLKDTYDFTTPAIIKSFKNNQKDEFVYECMYIGPSQKKFTTNESDLELYNSKNLDYDKMSDADFAFTILGKIVAADRQAWNETKADSGSEIRNSEKLTKLYAASLEKSLKDLKVKKNSLTEKEYDYLVDNNYHLLNEFLFWNDFYENDLAKGQKEMYQRLFDDKNNQSSTANPDWITIGKGILPHPKPKQSKTSIAKKDGMPKFVIGDIVVLKGETTLEKEIIDRRMNNKNQYVYKAKYVSKPTETGEWNENELDFYSSVKKFKAGDTISFTVASNKPEVLVGKLEYRDSYGLFTVVDGREYELKKLLEVKLITKPKKPTVARTVKSELKKYYAHREIKTITVIEDGKKVVYKGEDVLNGAQFLAKGGKVDEIATYYPIRAIVEVTLDNGEKVKPANGYHIKNGAKPIAELGAVLATEEIINNSIETNPYHYAKGGLTSGSGDFDYIKFLDYVQPKVAATLLENNVTLLNDYTIVHEGKEFEPVIIYKGIDGKANALSVGYFADNDPQLKLLLSIDFELDEMEYHIRSKGWNINDVDMYAKGGWVKDHKYLNKAEAYEMRYAKGKNRKGYMEKGGEVFDYKNKYSPLNITNSNDVKTFFDYLTNVEKISFHPDDTFEGNMSDNFTKKQAVNLDTYMDDCFLIMGLPKNKDKDIYEIALNSQKSFAKGSSVVGRKAKGVSVKKIADMHNVTEKYLRKQLQRGQKVELEHTTDESVAYAIAKDHIYENPDYYILLEKIEMKANGGEVKEIPEVEIKNDLGDFYLVKLWQNSQWNIISRHKFKKDAEIIKKLIEEKKSETEIKNTIENQSEQGFSKYEAKYDFRFKYAKGGKVDNKGILPHPKPKREGSKIFAKAAEIREPGEKWQEAVRRANLLLKK